jgi:30S ribosomal protein S31
MGKGDQRTKRGKIWRGTYGKTRPSRRLKTKAAPAGPVKAAKPRGSARKAAAAAPAEGGETAKDSTEA